MASSGPANGNGDGVAHHSRPTPANAKLAQLEGYTVRVPLDGEFLPLESGLKVRGYRGITRDLSPLERLGLTSLDFHR